MDIPVVQVLTPCDFDVFDEKLIKIVSGCTGANAGDYQVRLALKDKEHFQWEDGTTEDKYVTWTIQRRSVGDKPTDRTVTFDGKPHDNGYDKPHYVKSSGIDVAREAGEYFAHYKPYDNYCWSDGSYGVVAVKLTIEKADPKYSAPTPIEGLFYTGSYQELIKRGHSFDGTMMYKVDSAGSSGNYTSYVPTGLRAKTYTVSYYVAGDKNHKDSEPVSFEVVIDVNNRTHLALNGMPDSMIPGESAAVGIDTNSNGTLSCYSSSGDVGCSIDSENMLLYLTVSEDASAQDTDITISVSGGDYKGTSTTYPLSIIEIIEDEGENTEEGDMMLGALSVNEDEEEIDPEAELTEEVEKEDEEDLEGLENEDLDKENDKDEAEDNVDETDPDEKEPAVSDPDSENQEDKDVVTDNND
ncbi:MAG: hypothetical protein J6S49_06150, partial [Erysipelotrichaceae bacterium]|nr:hypothetical protein [Erysipelotrichaceae bacterium]